ncbi:hypothetical protein [Staphylococcus argenteus]|uniref:hypothetical protein n=1 Tax=Staphylococcus argenteus TaxID=985002 RepID=UPI000500B4B6|nr:hypothetical protein [Staphylococcus argenteus]CDR21337.1 acetoin utilization protein [Staphylococcus argenteus]
MNHVKTYQVERYRINDKEFVIEGPMSYDDLKTLTFDEHLSSFRDPEDQFEALLEITTLKEGRIYIVRLDQLIVGYVTYHYPDEIERWSTGNLPYLIELGAIEVSINFRQLQLAEKLIQLSLSAPEFEDYIVITTEYYWHWDLKNSKLDVFEYKKIMQRLMATGGLEIFATDDPEITSHPANCLMARIGKYISIEQQQAFDDIRYMNRFFF